MAEGSRQVSRGVLILTTRPSGPFVDPTRRASFDHAAACPAAAPAPRFGHPGGGCSQQPQHLQRGANLRPLAETLTRLPRRFRSGISLGGRFVTRHNLARATSLRSEYVEVVPGLSTALPPPLSCPPLFPPRSGPRPRRWPHGVHPCSRPKQRPPPAARADFRPSRSSATRRQTFLTPSWIKTKRTRHSAGFFAFWLGSKRKPRVLRGMLLFHAPVGDLLFSSS